MIDSVLKGTGNSRFLKSAVPAGTSWADALAMLQAGTFPIDFNGINAEGFQQVGTPLNKANLLKDATAAQIGLPPSTTPDGMFQALAKTGDLHVWRKTEKVGSKGYYLDTVSSGQLCIVNSSAYVVTFSYSSTVSAEGVLTGTVNTVSLSGTNDQTSELSVLRGKFCKAESNGSSDSVFTGIIYIPNDATFTYQRDNGDYRSHHVSKKQTVIFTDAPTTTTYHVSTNPNAYQEGDDAKEAGYTLGKVVIGETTISHDYNASFILYGPSIKVSDNGTISIVDGVDEQAGSAGIPSSWSTRYSNKFIQCHGETNSGLTNYGQIMYIPSDGKVRYGTDNTGQSGIIIDRYQPVTGYAAIPAGTTIEYLGKLGDKARVQVLSYVGTGTYGSSNPNSLTFDFVPKAVFLFSPETHKKCFVAYGDTDGYPYDDNPNGKLNVSWDKKKMSWFQYDSANNQLNLSNYKYRAIAIG